MSNDTVPYEPDWIQRFSGARRQANGWVCRCPAHHDRVQSLSIYRGEDGQWHVHCHAGCDGQAILQAAGLTWQDIKTRPPEIRPLPPRIVAEYDYRDETGTLVYQVVRYAPKAFRQRRPLPGGGWAWDLRGIKPLPYRLPELLASTGPVYVVEGEKDVETLRARGLTATCNSGGAGKWRDCHAQYLSGREVIVIPDSDEAGRKHAQRVRETLERVGARVRVLELPAGHKDVTDYIEAGGSIDDLMRQQAAAPAKPLFAGGTSAELVLTAVLTEADLWVCDDQAWATVVVAGRRANMPVRSTQFRAWVQTLYLRETGRAVGEEAARKIAANTEAIALYGWGDRPPARQERTYIRVAERDGAVYYDLGDETWRAVEITPSGWRIVDDPPVRFRRAAGMLPLPVPEPGGSVDLLRPLINAGDDETWMLIVAWLIGAVHPTGPYPALVLQGEQGTAKSTTARLLRDLIDPNLAPLRTVPADQRDLMVTAANSHVLCIDNLSGVQPWLSDVLCRIATGAGIGTRRLYTDDSEAILYVRRPIILTGIDEVASRADLRERAIILTLDRIPDGARLREELIMDEYQRLRPRILGALFGAVSTALRRRSAANMQGLPRMADFGGWVASAEPALGWQEGRFLEVFREMYHDAVESALEGAPLVEAIRSLVAARIYYAARPADLLQELTAMVDRSVAESRGWPRDPRWLSRSLRRLAPELLRVGVDCQIRRDHDGRRVVLRLVQQQEVA